MNEFDHANIFQSTKSACPKWRAIGWELDFTTDELDAIVREPGRNGDEDYYEAMLRRWLDWAPPNHTPPSFQSLLSALRAAGKERQANDLAAKYKVCGHTGVSVLVTMWGKRLSQGFRKAVTSSSIHLYIVPYNIRGHHILKFCPIYFLLSSLFLVCVVFVMCRRLI